MFSKFIRRSFIFIVFLTYTPASYLVWCTEQHIVATPLLHTLLDDIKLYKLDSEGDQYLHAGDLYEHSVWTYNAMVELLRGDLPYIQDLQLT